jgi:hypothetical protein
MSPKFVFLSSFASRFFQCLVSFVFPLAQSISSVQMMPEVDLPLFNVNWIYAIATFTIWRYAITKIKLGNMPLQLTYTSSYAILFNTNPYTVPYTLVYTFILPYIRRWGERNDTKFPLPKYHAH